MSVLASVNELILPAHFFGIIAILVFIAIGLFTFSFRDVANRHKFKAEAYAKAHPEHEAPLNEFGEPKH